MKKVLAILMLLCTPAAAQNYLRDDGIFHSVVEGTTTGQCLTNSGNLLAGTTCVPPVIPQQYGAKCDGTTDDATALQAWLNAIPGKTGYVPAGLACVTGTTLLGLDNTTIIGGGQNVSTLKGIGAANPVIKFSNKSNIAISDLTLQGSDSVTSWTSAVAGAIAVSQDNGGTNYSFRNLTLKGFNSTYWMYFNAGSGGSTFTNITIDNVHVVSVLADIPTDATTTNNANHWLLIQSGSGGAGRVENLVIRNNKIEGSALCFGAILYGNIYKYTVQNNQLLHVGETNTVAHCTNGIGVTNSYALTVYDLYADGNPASDGLIEGNYILSPYSAGIYFAGDGNPAHTALSYNNANTLISGNQIVLQSSPDETLPRAAISLNLSTNISVLGNYLYANYSGVAANGQTAGAINISNNFCTTLAGASSGHPSSCIELQAGAGTTGNTTAYLVKNNHLDVQTGAFSQVVRTLANAANYYGSIDFTNNKVVSSDIGVNFAGIYSNKRVNIQGNHFSGVAATNMLDASSITGAPVVTKGNVFDLGASTAGLGMKVDSSLAYLSGDLFMNRNSGAAFAFSGVSATGTLSGMQFSNVATANQVVASSIGLALPTWSAAAEDFVQNLQAASGTLIKYGWLNPTNGTNWITANSVGLSATNTVLGNATSGSATPTALAVGSCSTASSALIWTTNTGFDCNTSITATAVPLSGITGLGTGIATALAISTGSAGAPVLFNGAGGTPSSLTLTSATGLPISTGLSGAGTGVLTALGISVGSAGAFITFNGNAGTPSALVGTNISGTAASLTAGHVTTNANLTGDVTSVGNATTLAAGNAGNLNSGTLLAARMPALTGDVTTSAGAVATTLTTAQPAVHTWALAQTFTVAPVFTDQSGSRTALGLGTMATQNASAVAVTGGTLAGLTGLAVRDTSAAFDLTIAATSSPALTAGRTLTINIENVSESLNLNGSLTLGSNFVTSGNFPLTLTQTASTNVTLPTTGTLATLAGAEAFTNKTSISSAIYTGSGAVTFQSNGSTLAGTITTGQKWGIGPETNPQYRFVASNNTATGITIAPTVALFVDADGSNSNFHVASFGTGVNSGFFGTVARGTAASPTQTKANDIESFFGGRGLTSTAATYTAATGFAVIAAEDQVSATNGGTYAQILLNAAGSTARDRITTFQASGGLSIGGQALAAPANDPGNGGIYATGATIKFTALANVATTSALCYNTGTGLLTYDGTIGTCTVSDERLKNMGERIHNALERLLKINGVYYTWKDPASMGNGRQIGVGAQTVEAVFPELVQSDSSGYKSADYQRLTAPIIEAMRELKADNDNLNAEVQSLKRGKR